MKIKIKYKIKEKTPSIRCFWLIWLFIITLVLIIRFYPLTRFSPAPSVFSSYIAFSDHYTLKNNHLVRSHDIEVYNQFSAQLATAAQLHPILVLRPMLSLVTSAKTISWEYNLLLSIVFCVPFLLVMLLLARIRSKIGVLDSIIIGLYSLLAAPNFIYFITYGGASLAYLVIGFTVYYYLRENKIKRRGIIIFLAGLLAISYFTGAIAFLLLLIYIAVFEFFTKPKKKSSIYFILIFILIYSILFFVYLRYISTSRFGGLVRLIKVLPLFFRGDKNVGTMARIGALVSPYLTSTSFMNKFRIAINGFFVAIPYIYFIIWGRRYFSDREEKIAAFSIAFSLPFFGVLTFLVIGGLGRVVEYGTLSSILLFALMAGKIKRKHWISLCIVAVLAVSSSVYAYMMDENLVISHLTYPEKDAAYFLSSQISEQSVIFTDYRLAATPLSKGHFKTTGITMITIKTVESELNMLQDIYWGDDIKDAMDALKKIQLDGKNVDYLFFSKGMTRSLPGIRTYSFNFKPAPSNFYVKYDANPVNKVYDNDEAFVYYINWNLLHF